MATDPGPSACAAWPRAAFFRSHHRCVTRSIAPPACASAICRSRPSAYGARCAMQQNKILNSKHRAPARECSPVRRMKNTSVAGFHIQPAVRADVPVIFSFIKKLADYERLSHEVVATEELLRETLFGRRRTAEVALGYFKRAP